MNLLRNKKSGEIKEGYVEVVARSKTDGAIMVRHIVGSVSNLNKDWEDYVHKQPLIKDEKIRKAVRAWAEANDRDLFKVINEHFNCCKIIGYTDGGNAGCDKIEFSTTISGAKKGYYYTLTELCGEAKE